MQSVGGDGGAGERVEDLDERARADNGKRQQKAGLQKKNWLSKRVSVCVDIYVYVDYICLYIKTLDQRARSNHRERQQKAGWLTRNNNDYLNV